MPGRQSEAYYDGGYIEALLLGIEFLADRLHNQRPDISVQRLGGSKNHSTGTRDFGGPREKI
jgi:hypothetical protein